MIERQGNMLATLEAQVDPKQTAVLVVDIQNDFCAAGGTFDRSGKDLTFMRSVVPKVGSFLREVRHSGAKVIWIKMSLADQWIGDPWRVNLVRRDLLSICVPGTWGEDYYEIRPAPGDIEVAKYRYSAFVGTNLELILKRLGIKTLIMTGMATNVCVESTARDAFMRDFYVVFLEDCLAAGTREAHEASLRTLGDSFGFVTSSSEVVTIWSNLRESSK